MKEYRILIILLIALFASTLSIFLVNGSRTIPIAMTVIIVSIIALFIAKKKI